MLQEPTPSPYDLRFRLLGFPVRIAWGFWVMAVVFGYSWVQSLDGMLRELSPGIIPLLVLWSICVFVSILIHELGHALAFRQNGIESSVVLYHFGGLAIPRSGRSFGSLRLKDDLWISLAGPLAQLFSAVVVIVLVKLSGYRLDQFDTLYRMPEWLQQTIHADDGAVMISDSVGLYAMVDFYLFPSIFWAILNLIPVLPLDGGRIASSLVQMRGGSIETALWISVIAAGLAALYGFSAGQQYMGLLFIALGVMSYQQLQSAGGGSY
ncbi:Peptidase family M50 [Rubripirellula lacrimiformis]|uniref:Peptidase family M50 n=1 Tax=Rubripirellula lacrimiformis TaxID=1930273 RepID=A0A517NLQ4_9BACT|nr:site-2 protease family protein [Rubripirellula lacrimiformis]QDT08061.1 Peptidase family M50 [Rubripirellula lacrimiformis]